MSDNQTPGRYALPMMNERPFIAEVFDLMDDFEQSMTVREITSMLAARILRSAVQYGISPISIPVGADGRCEEDVDNAALVEDFLMEVRPPHDAHDYLDDYWNFLWEEAWPEGLAHVIFDIPAHDHVWAADLLRAVDAVVEDVGFPEPHCFEVGDFEIFIAQWRADSIRELGAMKGAIEGLQALSDLPFGDFADTYSQALPHFKNLLRVSRRAGHSLKDFFKLLIEQFGHSVEPYAFQFARDERLNLNLTSLFVEHEPAGSDRGSNSLGVNRAPIARGTGDPP